MTTTTKPAAVQGVEQFIPLNKLKKSRSNARKASHGDAAIEALAASIEAKGMLQNLVVEPERNAQGKETGFYYVTAGEGRRLAQLLRAKRRQIAKDEPIRCIVDVTNDPLEVSLDENVTRTEMHPADQYEAFLRLSEERGWGAEEIAARFGLTPDTVRRRMRLAAVSPRLMQLYRDGELTLDQLSAFAISDDHERQEQVHANLGWNDDPYSIRHAMMETHVAPNDRRARFVGDEAYTAAGGVVVRDLFSDEDAGYFEDAALLDRLVAERLETVAAEVRAEGWKWVETSLDFPYDHGMRRVFPQPLPLPARIEKRLDALRTKYDALVEEYEGDEEMPDKVIDQLEQLEADIERLAERESVFDADVMAFSGVHVSLNRDGTPRIDRGFVRPEDDPRSEPTGREPRGTDDDTITSIGGAGGTDDGATPGRRIPDALVRKLTAHRTLGLRVALGQHPDVALVAMTHVLATHAFFAYASGESCLEIRSTLSGLHTHAEEIEETAAAQALKARHEAWAAQMPSDVDGLWTFVAGLDADRRMKLFAHCVALTANAVQQKWGKRSPELATADVMAEAVSLDMTAYWTPTARHYLGRVSKAHILDAVREGVSEAEAARITDLKKQPMVDAAEALLAETGWLPDLLRAPAHRDADTPEPYADAA